VRIQRHVRINNPNVLSQSHNVKVFYVNNYVNNFKKVISNIRKSLLVLNSHAESRSILADLY